MGELRAPRGARLLALVTGMHVAIASAVALARAMGRGPAAFLADGAAVALVLLAFSSAVALVGFGVRAGKLTIDAAGVKWGVGGVSFRMKLDKLRVARLYDDALALVPKRGATWYLVARDWTPWGSVGTALRASRLPMDEREGRAPIGARLQGYGLALDLILVANAALATLVAWG